MSIVDTNIDSIPELPTDHPHHHARLEARLKIQKEIDQNRVKRTSLLMEARSKLYQLLAKSVENTAPVLHQELFDKCNLEHMGPEYVGYFDSPRAWRIIQARIKASLLGFGRASVIA